MRTIVRRSAALVVVAHGLVAAVLAVLTGARLLRREPKGLPAAYRNRAAGTVAAANAAGGPTAPVTEHDLARLPAPVAAYVRASGAVGRPHVVGFRAVVGGRIRSGPDRPWMSWTGEQVNTFVPAFTRTFSMRASMRGVPADVLHTFVGTHARMQVRLASIVTLVDADGPELDRAEAVTLLNDLCVLAPAALVDAPVTWTPVDDRRSRVTFTNAGVTVSALLVFGEDGRLVDFVSDDRLRLADDGRTFTSQRWSTPLAGYDDLSDGRWVARAGRGRWHPADGDAFDYLEFRVDDLTYLHPPTAPQRAGVFAASR